MTDRAEYLCISLYPPTPRFILCKICKCDYLYSAKYRIDGGSIKVIGIPESPWICGDEFYQKLKRKISLRQEEKRKRDTIGTLEERGKEYEIKRR